MAVVNPCALRTLDGSPVSIFHVGSAKSSKAVHDDHLQRWGRDDAVCAAELGRIRQHAGEIFFISFLTAPNLLNLNLLISRMFPEVFGARFRSQVEHLHCRVRGYLAHAADPSDWTPGRRMEQKYYSYLVPFGA